MPRNPEPLVATVSHGALKAVCGLAVRRRARVRVEGLDHLPTDGPTLLVARHVHYVLDGCVLERTLPRPLHAVLAVDWLPRRPLRDALARAARLVRWPAVMRPQRVGPGTRDEAAERLRAATREAVGLLREGRLLLIFPEGFPAVDPRPTPKRGLADWLPFDPGFARIVRIAQGDDVTRVAVVPVGIDLAPLPDGRWRMTLRLGPARRLGPGDDPAAFAAGVEAEVRRLSRPV